MAPESYDATKDPRTGRPILPQDAERMTTAPESSWEDEKDRQIQQQRSEHHASGIPPYNMRGDYSDEDGKVDEGDGSVEPINQHPGVMRAPEADEEPRESSYQVSIENASIAAKDYVLEASGVVNIEEYRGEDFICRITVEVCTEAEQDLSMADANGKLLDAAVEVLQGVCNLDKEILHRSIVN